MPQAIAYAAAVISNVVVAAFEAIGASEAVAVAAGSVAVAVAAIATTAAVVKAISPPKPKALSSAGTQLQFKADPEAGIPFVLGETATAGNIVFQYPSGAKNRYLNFFTVLSGAGPIEAITQFTADKTAVTFNSNGSVTSGGSYAAKMWMILALGLTPATALACPTDLVSSGDVAEWTSSHKLSGLAAARWTLDYDTTVYASGVPQPLWLVKGLKVYDPRLDSTYPGGSGSQRANDRTTWTWSDNPYLHGLTYCLGYTSNGKRVGGVGCDIAMIDVASFVEGANVADANGWKVGGVITSLDSKWQALTTILQAGSGVPLPSGGLISCRANTPRTSLETIEEWHIAGPCSVSAVKSRRDRVNAIIPRYRSADHDWAIVSAAPVTSSTYQALDGELRQKETEYTLCQDAGQAAVLAAYDLVNAREFGPVTLALKPSWMGYRIGDCLTLNLPELGLNNQKAVITSRDFDLATGIVSLTFDSETDAKHAYALGQTASPPPTPGLTVPDFATVPTPDAGHWSAVGTALTGAGASVPCIAVFGDATDYPFCLDIAIDYRATGTTDWTQWGKSPATATLMTVAGLGGDENYDIGISYVSVYGIQGPRLVISSILTPAGAGVASSIDNQGPWATEHTPVSSVLTPTSNLIYNPSGLLGNQKWTAGLSTFTPVQATASEGPYWDNASSDYTTGCNQFQDVPAYAAAPYSLSAEIFAAGLSLGGGTYAQARAYVQWLDSAKTTSLGFGALCTVDHGSGWTHVHVDNAVAPTGTAWARVYMDIAGDGSWANTNCAWRRLKLEQNVVSTPFSDETTNGALYRSGQTVDDLQPEEAGANVTETRVANSINSQGALATQNQADWAAQVTGVHKPQDDATASFVYYSATAPSSPGVNDIWVQLNGMGQAISVQAWNGSAWVVSSDVTGFNVASGFAGQGGLSLLNSVGPTTIDPNAIQPSHLDTNATKNKTVYFGSAVVGNGSEQDVFNESITLAADGAITAFFYAQTTNSTGAGTAYTYKIYINGVATYETKSLTGFLTMPTCFFNAAFLTAGTYTVRVTFDGAAATGGGGGSTGPFVCITPLLVVDAENKLS